MDCKSDIRCWGTGKKSSMCKDFSIFTKGSLMKQELRRSSSLPYMLMSISWLISFIRCVIALFRWI